MGCKHYSTTKHRTQRQKYREEDREDSKGTKIVNKEQKRMSIFGINPASVLICKYNGEPVALKKAQEAQARFLAAEKTRQARQESAAAVSTKTTVIKPRRTVCASQTPTIRKAAPRNIASKETSNGEDSDGSDSEPAPGEPACLCSCNFLSVKFQNLQTNRYTSSWRFAPGRCCMSGGALI